MTKNLNISVLVAARDEYIDQLKCIMVPLLIQGFNSIYQDALRISSGKQIIWKFQELLKQIPQWNQTILQEESKRIKRKCPYIMDIVTAIFVTNVKILASVRLKGSRDDIRVKIPTSDIFIHSIYIESAQQIFYDPFLFYHKNGFKFGEVQNNKYQVRRIIDESVDETIRQMLPFDDILQKYLADALNDNAEFGDGESESEEEPLSDSDEESINNDDLPSDESDFEEPDPDKDRVKTFQLDNKPGGSQFIPDPEDEINEIDEEETVPHFSSQAPFTQPPPPQQMQQQNFPQVINQPQVQQQPQSPHPQQLPQPQLPPQQIQQPQNGSYSFF